MFQEWCSPTLWDIHFTSSLQNSTLTLITGCWDDNNFLKWWKRKAHKAGTWSCTHSTELCMIELFEIWYSSCRRGFGFPWGHAMVAIYLDLGTASFSSKLSVPLAHLPWHVQSHLSPASQSSLILSLKLRHLQTPNSLPISTIPLSHVSNLYRDYCSALRFEIICFRYTLLGSLWVVYTTNFYLCEFFRVMFSQKWYFQSSSSYSTL